MRNLRLAALAAGMAVCFLLPAQNASDDMRIWYDRIPDANWTSPLPVGNGYLAGLVYGKVWDEKIALNETSFWSGGQPSSTVRRIFCIVKLFFLHLYIIMYL